MTVEARLLLAHELRRLREDAHLSGEEVARRIGWSQSKISRVENGRFRLVPRELSEILSFYDVPEELRAELYGILGEDDGVPGVWVTRPGGPRSRSGDLAALETRTRRIRQYGVSVVPGQLQSREYAMASGVAGGWARPEVAVARRMTRQVMLAERPDLRYEAVLDARLLLAWPGGPSVMSGQMEHLRRRAALPNVDVRILPLGAERAAISMTPFSLYSFVREQSRDVVYVEQHSTDVYLSAEHDVQMYAVLFERLRTAALPPEESLAYLDDLAALVRRAPGRLDAPDHP